MTVSTVRIGTENSPNSAPLTRYVAIRVRGIPAAVRWSFLLFVFSFPFEAINMGAMTGSVTIVRLGGFLFFAFYLLYYGPFLGTRLFAPISIPMYWFMGYLFVYLLNLPFVDERFMGDFSFWVHWFTLIQFLVLFWIASDLLTEQKMARNVLLTYSVASGIVALGVLLQVPGFYEEMAQGRVTALADNPGAVAERMAFAAVITVGLYLYRSHKHFLSNFLLLVLTLAFLLVMVKTGGRGPTIAFMIGGWVYLLPYGRSKRAWTGIILALLAIIGVVYISASNPEVLERWRLSSEGDLAGRQFLWPEAFNMILERPIFGWHPGIWDYELGRRIGLLTGKDAHNLFLSILLEVGVIGASPFFVGLWLCGRSAWRARRGNLGVLPLALMVTALVCAMDTTSIISSGSKVQWLFLALTAATVASAPRKLGEQDSIHLVSRPIQGGRKA